jgi:hypothetical protein
MGPGWMPTLSKICWKVSTTSMKPVLREKLIKSFAPPAKSPKDLSGLQTGTHRTKLYKLKEPVKKAHAYVLFASKEPKRGEHLLSPFFLSLLVFLLCEWEVAVLPVLSGREKGNITSLSVCTFIYFYEKDKKQFLKRLF